MRKALRIAIREYLAMVKTKGFIIGLAVAPLFMGGSIIAMLIFKENVDTTDQTAAIVDRSGVVAEARIKSAQARNDEVVYNLETGKKVKPVYKSLYVIRHKMIVPMARMEDNEIDLIYLKMICQK